MKEFLEVLCLPYLDHRTARQHSQLHKQTTGEGFPILGPRRWWTGGDVLGKPSSSMNLSMSEHCHSA